jgi:hypothetical protein
VPCDGLSISCQVLLNAWNPREKCGGLQAVAVADRQFVRERALATASGSERLSTEFFQRVVNLADEAMRQPGAALVLQAAIDLAISLGDPNLVVQVEQMAKDVSEVYRRGVQDPEAAERIQRLAQAGLAGIR